VQLPVLSSEHTPTPTNPKFVPPSDADDPVIVPACKVILMLRLDAPPVN